MDSSRAVFVAADNLGHLEEGSIGLGGILKNPIQWQTGLEGVFPEDIGQGYGMGHGLHPADIHLGDFGYVTKDGFDLPGKPVELTVVQVKPCQLGDLPDMLGRYLDLLIGHRGGFTPACRPLASMGGKC